MENLTDILAIVSAKGLRGLRVQALQKALNLKGAKLTVDGVYGAATEKAVKKYGGEV